MALSRPGGSYAQPSNTVPGAPGGGSSQGITANAGSDVQSSSPANKSLSGSVSNGSAASWAWTLLSKPSSSSASITSASSQTATLTGIDKRGAYACKLVVTDSDGFTDADRVVIDYAPAAVVSNAGSDVQTASSSNQTLSGSGSGGTGTLTYAWTLVTKPSGSSASITSATSATATLTGIDNAGAYVCALVVTDSAATAISATDTVVIDYSASHTPAWTDVYDIDLTAATATTLTSGATTTIDGRDWFYRARTPADMSAVISGAGMTIDFNGNNAGYSRIFVQVAEADLTMSAAGYFPRIRAQIAFTSMTLATTNSFVGVGIAQDDGTGSGLDNPVSMCQYVQTGAGVYKYKAESAKGTFGSGASGTTTSSGVASDGNATTGVLEIVDIGQGLFRAGGHDGDQTLTSALETFRAWSTPTGSNNDTTDTNFYEVGSGNGPWVGMLCRNKTTGGTESVVITRIRIQEFV